MPKLNKKTFIFFLFYLLLGTIISTLGVFTLPVGEACSDFWPAVVLQALGGMWFGWIGVIGGTIFPVISNLIISGDTAHIIGYTPANFLQSLLPFLIYRYFRRSPRIANFRDFLFYFVFVCVISMTIAGFFGATSFYVSGARSFEINAYIDDVFTWAFWHFRMLLLFGVPMMIWFAPTVMEANIVKMYWSKQEKHVLQGISSLKVFAILGTISVLPIIVVGIYQMSTIGTMEMLKPNYMAIAINTWFFVLLIITALFVKKLSNPIQLLTQKIVELSYKYHLPDTLLKSSDENILYSSLLSQLEKLFEDNSQLERLKGAHEVTSEIGHDICCDSVDDLVQKGISFILENGRPIKTRAGDALQCYGVNYILSNSRNRVHTLRKQAARYFARELVAYFKGSLQVEEGLAKASKFWLKLADHDGAINSNYGYYVFYQKVPDGSETQYEWIRKRLIDNIDSRRAIININQAYHKSDTKDFPCTVSLQFFIKDKMLYCDVFSRSTDVITGLPYDMGFFSVVTELLWVDLRQRAYPDLRLGATTMRTVFTQIYSDKIELAQDTSMHGIPAQSDLSMPQISDASEVLSDIYKNSQESEFMQWIYHHADL